MNKVKVLFVCLGNICRSPLAEAIFKDKVFKNSLQHLFEIDSCGTSNYHIGDKPDERTLANAYKNGISIQHVGRQLQEHDLEYFDFILAMDSSNYHNIMRLSNAIAHQHKVSLMRSFDLTDDHSEVPDPYYGGERGFQEVFEILDRSTEFFLSHLKQHHLKDL